MKVLLVDDSNTMRKIQINILKECGITDIIEAADGVEGLKKLEANMPIDIMLLDINMPAKDGMTVLKEVRGNSKYNDVKIYMVTSEAEKQKILEAVRLGVNDYIVKPIKASVFKEKIGL